MNMEEESGRYLREGNRRSEGKTERVGLRSDEPSRRVAVPHVAAYNSWKTNWIIIL